MLSIEWALNKIIIKYVASSWFSLYSTIKMMHGPMNIRISNIPFNPDCCRPISKDQISDCVYIPVATCLLKIMELIKLLKITLHSHTHTHTHVHPTYIHRYIRTYVSSNTHTHTHTHTHTCLRKKFEVFRGIKSKLALRNIFTYWTAESHQTFRQCSTN